MPYISRREQLGDEHCRICGRPWGEGNQQLMIHHIDHNHSNDADNNHLIVCRKCHIILHNPKCWYTDAARRMRTEGYSMQIIANTFGVTRQRIYQIVNEGKLSNRRTKKNLSKLIRTAILSLRD